MARAVMRPLTATDRMQRSWSDGRATSTVVSSFIKPNDRLTSFDRLEIYNRQYWFRLLDCLHEDYPGLRAVLGTTRFHRLAIAYLTRYPSASPTLRELGSRLVQFLKEEPALTHPYETLALDMARLEWAQVVAFDGESRRATTLKHLARIPPDLIFLRLQPCITLLDLSYPVDKVIVRLIRKDGKLRSEASNAVETFAHSQQRSIARHVKPTPTWLLIHRQENSVYFKRLTEPEYQILRALDCGTSLSTACETLENLPSARTVTPQIVQTWFQTWATLGFLVHVSKGSLSAPP
jgi:hypothetical protein